MNAAMMTRQLTICFLAHDKSGNGSFIDVNASNKCLAGEMHWEALAESTSDVQLPNMWEPVIPSIAKKNGIYDDLRHQLDVPANIERQFVLEHNQKPNQTQGENHLGVKAQIVCLMFELRQISHSHTSFLGVQRTGHIPENLLTKAYISSHNFNNISEHNVILAV